jgi:hypothetical protein
MTAAVIADVAGMLGALLIVIAYFLLQAQRLDPRSLSYSVINGLGAAGIIGSLLFEFNLSAFALESFWLAISLWGIFRAVRLRRLARYQR